MEDRFRVRGWDVTHNHYEYDLQNMMYESEYYMFSGELDNMTLLDAISKGLVKEIIPEQCSGIRDECGQLIYEGDIVRWSFGNVLVRFDYDDVVSFAGLCGVDGNIKVIGNIHENPELLEGNNG